MPSLDVGSASRQLTFLGVVCHVDHPDRALGDGLTTYGEPSTPARVFATLIIEPGRAAWNAVRRLCPPAANFGTSHPRMTALRPRRRVQSKS